MNFKKSRFSIQGKDAIDLDKSKDYPTLDDLMREQNVSSDDSNTVHYRRDLDSLGQLLMIKIVMKIKIYKNNC